MELMRLVVLGGSSPYTAALIDELGTARALPPMELVLHGRDRVALGLVTAYAVRVLGCRSWTVRQSTDRRAALDGADFVVHQVRYGGLAGRGADERLAAELGVPADETLGPSGLQAALRAAPSLAALAEDLNRCCPNAFVLNLTNPLSCSTALLARWSTSRIIGLCELPTVTVAEACAVLGLSADEISWDYVGLNHRGFVLHLLHRGTDRLPELVDLLDGRTIGGITSDEIAALGALPVKYFRLLRKPAPPTPARADYLDGLRGRILAELGQSDAGRPPSLSERDTPWYREALVPVLAGLIGVTPSVQIVNVPTAMIAFELRANVSASGIRPLPAPRPPDAVRNWLERFEGHERAVLAACLDPSIATVTAALQADPIAVPGHTKVAARLLEVLAPV